MSHELLYTSVPRGLRTGEHGFCTVAATRGIPSSLAGKLESLCAYRHLFPPSDARAELNPVNFAHLRLQLEGRIYHVLSRVGDAGLDYSQRTNKLAHHVALDRNELPPGGPAQALSQRGFMETEWGDRTPQVLDSGRKPRAEDSHPRVCEHWEQITGDAGWAGYLAGMATGRPVCLIFRPGVDPLPLIAEALAFIPAPQRWNVTFSTYFTGLPPDVPCQWRCIVADSPEAKSALESGAPVILLEPGQDAAPDGPLVEAARTGRVPREAPAAKPTRAAYPVSAPAPMAPRFPVAPALATNEPATLEPLSEESLPMPLADPPSVPARSGGTLFLVLGLALGLVLMFLCVLPIELLTGKSLPGAAGIVGREEQEMKAKIESLDDDLKKEKMRSESLALDLENERRRTADRPPPKRPVEDDRPKGSWFGGGGSKGDSEKLKAELAEANERAKKLGAENGKLADRITKLEEEIKKLREAKAPAPMPAPAGASPPTPGGQKIQIEKPITDLSRADLQGKIPVPLKGGPGGKMELLGLPANIRQLKLSAESDANSILVRAGENVLATFHPGTRPEAPVLFEWGQTVNVADWKHARTALLLCLLKYTPKDSMLAFAYPLQQPESTVLCVLKPVVSMDRADTTFRAELPFSQDSLDDGGFSLGKSAQVAIKRQGEIQLPLSLHSEGDRLIKNTAAKPEIELTLDKNILELRFIGHKAELGSLKVALERKFKDAGSLQVAVIIHDMKN